ncbi:MULTISPECIES: sigma-70 family RNA polymerase sigma factor [Bacteroides]|jgi:RNA polymerase sigma factor (sigma-70 family)|uniref:Sigma-70 family RNA polymerase sigma factor n=1 Tax=Bacteroides difficilis TaxID=2763021 RepID=A0ABR7CBD2_9BACE|nr:MULTISPECIES: sigma-70 family RNA polymerase sigma factor [Bacteroides]MBC5605116.1 sigma-70 family RNA polymerase sigma factor [Bacteroides difficilis]MCS3177515.1 sigma-70 family RNA polymerase sigma factor [Candidatus Bacteroides intestinigallinarum]QNL37077.1 sigma-70 family RNA polymerase sigma factor [Bacteroides sp. M10]RGN55845.1 RNA polymerase subunit sigma-70 [Bacteroides sp. OM05-10AA]RGQ61007.1 RNA polymerase subunit sigma-70 [Bacteroides sp. AF27-33]
MENIDMSSVQLISDSYKNYHRSVYLYILYKIRKDEDAKDLSQDVFLRLMDYKQMLRPETIKHFIFSICRNLVIDYLRRHYKMQEITSYFLDQIPTSINDVESQIIANDISTCEQERVLRLPMQRRKIYVMSRFRHKSSAYISACLGLSVRTVENHLFVSRKEIREYIQQCI